MSKTVLFLKGRLSYCNLFVPRAIVEGGVPKYSISIIIPKDDKKQIEDIKEAMDAIIAEQKWTNLEKKKAELALRDGDDEKSEDEAYRDSYFINAKSATKPLVIDQLRKPVDNADIIYSGSYGIVKITLYPYKQAGNIGVGAGLCAVQKWKDGDPLGSVTSVDEFEDLPVEDNGLF